MITETPNLENKTLYEIFGMMDVEGFDICDDIWDWGIYIGCPRTFKECGDDYYEKCMLLFCLNIVCKKVQKDWYSICLVSKFIDENRDAFDKFMNEENREEYTPKYYDHKLEIEDPEEDFYDVYMGTMESLIAGNYSDRQYKKLYEYLGGKQKSLKMRIYAK